MFDSFSSARKHHVDAFSLFYNLISSPFSAYDVAQSKQHKRISASDVFKALETIQFGDMVNNLQAELLSA